MFLLADLVLLAHFLFVLFVVGGLLAILAGAALRWRWIRHFWFRLVHLGAIVFVAVESLLGTVCPLTAWEDRLRGAAPQPAGFIQRWVSRILFYDFPEWVFILAYMLFALLVAVTFYAIRPHRPGQG